MVAVSRHRIPVPRLAPLTAWLTVPTHLARITLGWCTVMHAVFGVAAMNLGDVRVPILWAWWFWMAGIACLVAMMTLESMAVTVAGAATITAFVARAAVLILSWADGTLDLDSWRVVMTVGSFLTLAFFASLLWFRGLLKLPRRGG